MGAEGTFFTWVAESDSRLMIATKRACERVMGFHLIEKLLDDFRRSAAHGHDTFWSDAARFMRLEIRYRDSHHAAALNGNKPLIIVANHPTGWCDSIAIAIFLQNVMGRRDFKFVSNRIIGMMIAEIRPYDLPLDNMKLPGSEHSEVANGATLSQAMRHLRDNHVLVIYPAGSVSQLRVFSPEGFLKVVDTDWNETFVGLAMRTGAEILPIHLSGRNSRLFQIMGFFGQTAKRIRLFREIVRSGDRAITVSIGKPVIAGPAVDQDGIGELVSVARRCVYAAKGRS